MTDPRNKPFGVVAQEMRNDGLSYVEINKQFEREIGRSLESIREAYGDGWEGLNLAYLERNDQSDARLGAFPELFERAERERQYEAERERQKTALSPALPLSGEKEPDPYHGWDDSRSRALIDKHVRADPFLDEDALAKKWAPVPPGVALKDVETPEQKAQRQHVSPNLTWPKGQVSPPSLPTPWAGFDRAAGQVASWPVEAAASLGSAALESGASLARMAAPAFGSGSDYHEQKSLDVLKSGVSDPRIEKAEAARKKFLFDQSEKEMERVRFFFDGVEKQKAEQWGRNFGELMTTNLHETRNGLIQLVVDLLALRPSGEAPADFYARVQEAAGRGSRVGRTLAPAMIGGTAGFWHSLATDPKGTVERFPFDTALELLPLFSGLKKLGMAAKASDVVAGSQAAQKVFKALEIAKPITKMMPSGKSVSRGVTAAMLLADLPIGGMHVSPMMAAALGTASGPALKTVWRSLPPQLKERLAEKWTWSKQTLYDKATGKDAQQSAMLREISTSGDKAEAETKFRGEQFGAYAAKGDTEVPLPRKKKAPSSPDTPPEKPPETPAETPADAAPKQPADTAPKQPGRREQAPYAEVLAAERKSLLGKTNKELAQAVRDAGLKQPKNRKKANYVEVLMREFERVAETEEAMGAGGFSAQAAKSKSPEPATPAQLTAKPKRSGAAQKLDDLLADPDVPASSKVKAIDEADSNLTLRLSRMREAYKKMLREKDSGDRLSALKDQADLIHARRKELASSRSEIQKSEADRQKRKRTAAKDAQQAQREKQAEEAQGTGDDDRYNAWMEVPSAVFRSEARKANKRFGSPLSSVPKNKKEAARLLAEAGIASPRYKKSKPKVEKPKLDPKRLETKTRKQKSKGEIRATEAQRTLDRLQREYDLALKNEMAEQTRGVSPGVGAKAAKAKAKALVDQRYDEAFKIARRNLDAARRGKPLSEFGDSLPAQRAERLMGENSRPELASMLREMGGKPGRLKKAAIARRIVDREREAASLSPKKKPLPEPMAVSSADDLVKADAYIESLKKEAAGPSDVDLRTAISRAIDQTRRNIRGFRRGADFKKSKASSLEKTIKTRARTKAAKSGPAKQLQAYTRNVGEYLAPHHKEQLKLAAKSAARGELDDAAGRVEMVFGAQDWSVIPRNVRSNAIDGLTQINNQLKDAAREQALSRASEANEIKRLENEVRSAGPDADPDKIARAASRLEFLKKKVNKRNGGDLVDAPGEDVKFSGLPFSRDPDPYNQHSWPRYVQTSREPRTHRRPAGVAKQYTIEDDASVGLTAKKDKEGRLSFPDPIKLKPRRVSAETTQGDSIYRIAQFVVDNYNKTLPAGFSRLKPEAVVARYNDVISHRVSSLISKRARGSFVRWLSEKFGLSNDKLFFNIDEILNEAAASAMKPGGSHDMVLTIRGRQYTLNGLLFEHASDMAKTPAGRKALGEYKVEALNSFYESWAKKQSQSVPWLSSMKVLEGFFPRDLLKRDPSKISAEMAKKSPSKFWRHMFYDGQLSRGLKKTPPFWPWMSSFADEFKTQAGREALAAEFSVPVSLVDDMAKRIKDSGLQPGSRWLKNAESQIRAAEDFAGLQRGALSGGAIIGTDVWVTPEYGRMMEARISMEDSFSLRSLGGPRTKKNVTALDPSAHTNNVVSNSMLLSFANGSNPVTELANAGSALKNVGLVKANRMEPGLKRDFWEAIGSSPELEADLISSLSRQIAYKKKTPVEPGKRTFIDTLSDSWLGQKSRKTDATLEQLWQVGDGAFKASMAAEDLRHMIKMIRLLRDGESVPVGAGRNKGTVVATVRGGKRLYSFNGSKKLPEGAALYRLLRDPAFDRARRLLLNYNDIGLLFQANKKHPFLSSLPSFFIYAWKSGSVGKRGIMMSMMSAPESLMGNSNSSAVSRYQAGLAFKIFLKRSVMLSVLHGTKDEYINDMIQALTGWFGSNAATTVMSEHSDPRLSWILTSYGTVGFEAALLRYRAVVAAKAFASKHFAGDYIRHVVSDRKNVEAHAKIQRLVARFHADQVITPSDLASVAMLGKSLGHNQAMLFDEGLTEKEAFSMAKVAFGGWRGSLAEVAYNLIPEVGRQEAIEISFRILLGHGWRSAKKSGLERQYLKAFSEGYKKGFKGEKGAEATRAVQAEFRRVGNLKRAVTNRGWSDRQKKRFRLGL